MATFHFDRGEHRAWLDGRELDGVTRTLAAVGISDFSHIPEQPKEAPPGFRSWRDYYMYRGSAVDDACKMICAGRREEVQRWLDSLAEPFHYWSGYVRAFEKFLKESGFKPLLWEIPVYEPVHMYFGIPDLVGIFQDQFALPDIKLTHAQRATRIQTAAYVLALPSIADRYEHAHEPHLRFSLELHKDGTYAPPEWYDDFEDTQIWLSGLAVARWIKRKG